jgi:hypothetical protein
VSEPDDRVSICRSQAKYSTVAASSTDFESFIYVLRKANNKDYSTAG